ncbi:MAG: hypothetical protein UT24_C0020G0014 [Candidatus Woesebacteria bacterium GW2011_GWB1_39_12]|uniref:Portal protein n=1 Tax=Candidatus Woesebacteria bacterium GW2011_GWB1_39_12 TaxID=1618574 RepID=A0A0G0QE04_9BACT|nr:MAG: hypothetical protein UT24_C0020G0014 [Candidatus Woesebacteria bacterium GW2011_GWB1_39_12]
MPTQEIKTVIQTAFEKEKTGEAIFSPIYSNEEMEYNRFWMKRAQSAYNQHTGLFTEFDDKSFLDWVETNRKSSNSYNPPKTNEEDSRIVSGITREKNNTILSALLNFNFEGNITAYDQEDNKLREMGYVVEDSVRKSRTLEGYEAKRLLYYKEFLDQGNVFVLEFEKENIICDKKVLRGNLKEAGKNLKSVSWEKKLKRLYSSCESEMISIEDVYLGNIKEFFIQKQPYVIIRMVKHYEVEKQKYGDWERWQNVSRKVQTFLSQSQDITSQDFNNWSMVTIEENMVEELHCFDPINNEYAIFLNGISMLPKEFPLTAISPSRLIPIAKGDNEPISRYFAYSRSTSSKTEVDQKYFDEWLRVLLLKSKKSADPPMANNTGKIISRKLMLPGKIAQGINPALIGPIGPTEGMTQAEFAMFSLVKQIINEKSFDPTLSGDEIGGNPTATEMIQRKQQQMMKLGQTIMGIVEFEKQLIRLRIFNILANWTKPLDEKIDEIKKEIKKIYRSFSVETTFQDNGKRGRRIISFDPSLQSAFKDKESLKMLADYENEIKKRNGEEVRFTFLNSEELKTIDLRWEIDITPTEKHSSTLDSAMFSKDLAEAYQFFGPQSVNQSYAKEKFAVLKKLDPDRFFSEGQQNTSMMSSETTNQSVLEAQMMPKTQKESSLNMLLKA